MKKYIILSAAMLVITSSVANAYVDNQFMKTEQYMLNTGYSTDMVKMLDQHTLDPYREPYSEPKNASTIWKRIYGYVAPSMYTDLTYYNHDIKFNTTDWKDF